MNAPNKSPKNFFAPRWRLLFVSVCQRTPEPNAEPCLHELCRGDGVLRGKASRADLASGEPKACFHALPSVEIFEAKPQRTLLFFILSGRGFAPARRVISAQKVPSVFQFHRCGFFSGTLNPRPRLSQGAGVSGGVERSSFKRPS